MDHHDLLKKFLKGEDLSGEKLLGVIRQARLAAEQSAHRILGSDSKNKEPLKGLIGNTILPFDVQLRAAKKLFETDSHSVSICRFILQFLPDDLYTEDEVRIFKVKLGRILIDNNNIKDLELVVEKVDFLAGEAIARLVEIRKVLSKEEVIKFLRLKKQV